MFWKSSSSIHLPVVTSRVARLNLKGSLSEVTLATILSGETCPPISLAEFENYLMNKEHSAENLQFVVWFKDYRNRYFTKPSAMHNASLPKTVYSHNAADMPAEDQSRKQPYILDDDAHDARARFTESMADIPIPVPAATSPASPAFSSQIGSQLMHPGRTNSSPPFSPLHHDAFASTSARGFITTDESPHKQECMRILATFLQPGAVKELNLEGAVRDTVVKQLSRTTHPDIFLPIYEEIYSTLENMILPRFLTFASTNINLSKQLFWYGIGLADILISLAIALSLILSLPTPPQTNRAWRLFSAPFAWLGSMQLYSAWRGFCSQVFGRNAAQLRVWEIQEVDSEARTFYEEIVSPSSLETAQTPRTPRTFQAPWDMPEPQTPTTPVSPTTPNSAVPLFASGRHNAPWEMDPPLRTTFATVPESPVRSRTSLVHASQRHGSTSSIYRRPPIFGPEKVVEDERIKEVHRAIMHDVLVFGAIYTVIFTGVVLSVPGYNH